MELYRVFEPFFRPIPNFELSLYECWIDGQSDELTKEKGVRNEPSKRLGRKVPKMLSRNYDAHNVNVRRIIDLYGML